MKYWVIMIFGMLIMFHCQHKENPVIQEVLVEDTLNLPHYPHIDYDAVFAHQKFSKRYRKEKYKILKKYYEDYWKSNQVSGGLLVAKNGEVIFENYDGFANIEKQEHLTQNTPIHIASVSKVLTALAILKLVEADKLKLEQLVSHIYPNFPYKDITIFDLLTHRSGLPNYAYFEHDTKYWDTHKFLSNQDVLDALIQKVGIPYSAPNENFSYSNTNYVLLALIIEKITGLKYPQAMKYIVFEPLKMNQTFVFDIKDSAKVSQSYTYANKKWDFNYLDNIYGDKNIYSTPRDLFKMDKAMYSKEFLDEKIKTKMKNGYSYEKKGIKNYGLGLRIMEWESGEKLWYHNGWWHGNYSSYVHAEKDSITIIALGNRQIRSVYSAFSLIGLLGDYPVLLEIEDKSDVVLDTVSLSLDSLHTK